MNGINEIVIYAFAVMICLGVMFFVAKRTFEFWTSLAKAQKGMILVPIVAVCVIAYNKEYIFNSSLKTVISALDAGPCFGTSVMSAMIIAVVIGVTFGIIKLTGMTNSICRAALYGCMCLIVSHLVVKTWMGDSHPYAMFYVEVAVFIFFLGAMGRYFWHDGLQNRAAILVGFIADLAMTYALMWELGRVGFASNLLGSWQAIVPSAVFLIAVYVYDIVFCEKRTDQERFSFKVLKWYSFILAICAAGLVVLLLTGAINQHEVRINQLINRGETALADIQQLKAMDGYSDLKIAIDEAIGRGDDAEVVRLTKKVKAMKKNVSAVPEANIENLEVFGKTGEFSVFFRGIYSKVQRAISGLFMSNPETTMVTLGKGFKFTYRLSYLDATPWIQVHPGITINFKSDKSVPLRLYTYDGRTIDIPANGRKIFPDNIFFKPIKIGNMGKRETDLKIVGL